MTKYRLLVAALILASFLSALLEMGAPAKKGTTYLLHMLFTLATLAIVLVIGYRAFIMIR